MNSSPNALPESSSLEHLSTADDLLDTLPWGVLVLDAQHVIRRVNQLAARWCQVFPEELLGRPLTEAALPVAMQAALRYLLNSAGALTQEVWLPQPQQWVSLTATRQAGGWVLYGQDVTLQKQREQQSQALAENTPDVFARWSPDLRLCYANTAFATTMGKPIDALLGCTLAEMGVSATVTGPYMASLQRVFATGQPQDHYNLLPTPEGPKHYHSRLVPELGNGTVETVLSIAHDITELKQTQAEALHLRDELAQQATDKYHALFYSMDQGFCVLEILFDATQQQALDFRYLELNPVFARQSGMPADSQGKTARELLPDLEPFWFETYGQVARTGITVRLEHQVPQVNRWFDVHAFRVGAPEANQVAVLFNDITSRKHSEESLRASEERQAFLLQLSDTLRPLTDPVDVQNTAARVLGERLGVERAYYVDIQEATQECIVARGWHQHDTLSHARRYPLNDWSMPWLLSGQTWVCHDVDTDPILTEAQRADYRSSGIRAAVVVPLLKQGRLMATLVVNQHMPRTWAPLEVKLAEETLERTWAAVERAQAEQALAASEAKYRILFNSIDEGFATVDVLFDEAGQAIDYRIAELNQAYEKITGMPRTIVGQWARELVPTVEEAMLRQYGEVVRTGQSVRYEQHVAGLGRWFDVFSSRVGEAGSHTVASVFNDITARKRHELNLAFLANLNVDFAPLLSAEQIMAHVSEQLGNYLHLSRCHLAELDTGADYLTVTFDWQHTPAQLPSLLGTHRVADYLTAAGRQYFSAGKPLVLNGQQSNPFISTPLDVLATMGFGSSVDIPLLVEGQWRFLLTVARAEPGNWRPDEVELLQQLATRIHVRLERAQAETALKEAHDQLAGVLEHTHDAFYGLDSELRFTYINQRAAQLWGRRPTDLLGHTYWQVFPQAVGSEVFRRHQEVLQTRQAVHLETMSPILGIWIEVSIYPSRQGGISVFFRDITARRHAEERQAFLLQLSDTLRPLTDPVAIQETVTHLARRHFEADRCYYVEIEGDDATIRREAAAEGLPSVAGVYRLADFALLQAVIEAGQPFVLRDVRQDTGVDDNLRHLCAQLQIVSLLNLPVIKSGRAAGVMCLAQNTPRDWTATDITLAAEVADRTWAAVARARAEAARHASEQRLRAVMENLPGAAVFVVDADLRYQVAEGAALRQMGLQAADFVGQSVQALAPPHLWPDYERHYRQALAGQPFEYEHDEDGRVFATRGGPLRGDDGTIVAVLAVSYDVTASRRAEAAVRHSEEQFRLFVTASSDTLYRMSPDWQQMLMLKGKNFLANSEELNTSWVEKYIPLEDRDSTWAAIHVAIDSKQPFELEHRIYRADGRVAWTFSRAVPVLDAQGNITEWFGTATNINARKQAEAALQESEEKYRTLFDSIDEGYCIMEVLFDADGQPHDCRYLEVNPAFEKNYGLANATGKTIRELTPDMEPKWFATYGQVAQTGEPLRFEEDSVALGRWFSLYAFSVGEPGSNLVAVLFTDITARRQVEEALRLSEVRLSLALQAGRMGSFEWTSEGSRISLSAMSEEVLGIVPGTIIQTSHEGFALIHPDDRTRHQAIFDEAGRTGEDFHSIFRVVRPIDGEVRWIEERGQGAHDPAVGGICLRGVHWDVTETMLAQQRLAEFNTKLEQRVVRRTRDLQASRDLLQSVFDTNLIAMSVQKAVRDETGALLDFRLQLVSQELVRETGRTDLVGKLYSEEYPGIREAGIFDLAVQTVETGNPHGTEYYYNHEGFDKWFACQFVKLGDGIVATNLDITERKVAEQERQKNLRLLEQAEAVAGLGSWDYELATGTMRWSAGMYQLFGWPLGCAVVPASYLEVVDDDDRALAEQLVARLTKGTGDFEATLRLHLSGQVKTVRMKAMVLHDEQGQAERVLGVDLDISELQRLEKDNLRLRLRQQRALFEAVQAAQETERKRMAESLHNGIGQMLYATKLRLDRLHAPLLGTDPVLAAARREADQLLGEAIRQTRALSHELVPMVLEEFGFEAALKDICRNMSTPQLHLQCQLLLDEAAAPLSPALQMALYRMAQELAQNIVKHAQGASEASLELETMPGWVVLRAEDNGPGFTTVSAEPPGLGLRSMRDRVALLGGQLEIGTVTSGGAYVRIRIPLPTTSPSA